MSCKVFVGGILPSTTDDVLRRHFEKYGPVADAVTMRDRGFGFVTFDDPQSANDAISQNHVIDGQSVNVKTAVAKNGGGRGGGGGGGGGAAFRPRGPGGPGGPGGDGRATDKIFVGGLPQDCSDDKVRAYFSAYGHIVDAVVMKDRETGRSRGFGFVQFDSTEPVEKVMEDYQDHKLEGKWVEVKRSVPREEMSAVAATPPRGGGGSRPAEYSGNGGYGDYGMQPMAPPPPAYGAYGGYGPYGAYGAYPGYGAYPAYGHPYGAYMPPPGGVPGHYGAYGGYGHYPPAEGSPAIADRPPTSSRDSRSSPY